MVRPSLNCTRFPLILAWNTSTPGDSLSTALCTFPNAPRPSSSSKVTCSGQTSKFWRGVMSDLDLKKMHWSVYLNKFAGTSQIQYHLTNEVYKFEDEVNKKRQQLLHVSLFPPQSTKTNSLLMALIVHLCLCVPQGYFATHLQHKAINFYKHASILRTEFVLESLNFPHIPR